MRARKKLGYAIGDMGISISYFAVGFFFMFYLTDIVGLSPALAGTAIFIGKLWDGVNDPLMGVISDRTRSRFGRKRVYLLFGSVLLALSFVLLWMIPRAVSVQARFLWATITLLLYSTAYTVVVVPYMALVPVLTDDYDERTQITSLRAILSAFGTVIGGGVALLLSGFTDQEVGLRIVAVGFAFFTMVSLLVAAVSVKGAEDKQGLDSMLPLNFHTYLRMLTDRNLRTLLGLKFFGAVATGSLTATFPFFAVHVLRDQGSSTMGVALYTVCAALSIPFWQWLTRKYDKRRLLLIANLLVAMILFGLGIGVTPAGKMLFLIGCGMMGMVFAAYLFLPYSFVPDLVDYYEYKTGERHESVFFGLWITVHQLGIAASSLLLGFALQILGYNGSLSVQTDSGIMAIRISFGLIPGVFLVIAALVLKKYFITREVYQKIKLELNRLSSETVITKGEIR